MRQAGKAYSQQIEFLKKDRILRKAIAHGGELKLKKNNDLYFLLLRAIVGQQLSVKAAATIWSRFIALFPGGYPHAEEILKLPDTTLRSVGLSFQKAGYLKNIASFSIEQTLDYKVLKKKTDQELIDYLVQIKGVGRWTVEMILMFSLNREDIFPKDDLGIQTGICNLYNIKPRDKKQLFKKMDGIAEGWRPYRTLACMYIWKYKDSLKGKN